MGTLHKESRQRIEELRACHAISYDEWLCMARVLETLDERFTSRCRKTSVGFDEIAEEQRALYSRCLTEPDDEKVECGLLSSDPGCLATTCG